MAATLYFIVPCYKEASVLPAEMQFLAEKHKALAASWAIAFKSMLLDMSDGNKTTTRYELAKHTDEAGA